MFLRIFDLQDARSYLRWEHTTRPTAARCTVSREPQPGSRTTRAQKQCMRAAPTPVDAPRTAPLPAEPTDDFVHVTHLQEDEMHDFELV